MANTVTLKFIVDDDGTLRALGKDADLAADKTEELGNSTENLNKRKKRYNKVEKGVAQATSNTTKGFAKQTGAVNGGLVPAYAVLASNVFALSAAFNFLKRAFDVQALETSQTAFAANTGTALGSLTQRLRNASDGMLGFQEAGQAAAIGLAKGFSPKQLEELAVGARKVSTALGRDFQDSFDRLVRGASKAEPELLDELGITLKLETATQRYADAIGKNRDELNEFERSQAVLIETQRQLNESFGDVEAVTNPFIRLQKTFEELVKDLTGAVMPVLQGVLDVINRSTGAAVAVFGLLGVNIIKSMIPFDELSGKVDGFFSKSVSGFKKTGAELVGFGRDIRKVNKEIQASRAGALKTAARAAVAEGGTGKILQKMKKGMALTPQEKGIIKKAIRDAEADYKKFGEVTTQIFKGVNIAIVRDVGMALKQTEMGAVSAGRTFGRVFKGIQLGAKFTGKALILGLKAPLVAIGKTAQLTGKLIGKAMNFAGFIGIFLIIKEAVQEILAQPFSIVMKVASAVDTVLGFIAKPINSIAEGLLKLADSTIDTFNQLEFEIKTAFFNVASAVLGAIDNIINGFIGEINKLGGKLNKFLPKDLKLPIVEFKSELQAGLGSAPVLDEASKLAAGFKGLDFVSGEFFTNLAKNSSIVQGFKITEDNATNARNSTEALNEFIDTSDKLEESVSAISDGLKKTEDEAQRGFSIAEAIRTLNISSAFEAITRTRAVLDADGREIGRQSVMTSEDQRAALDKLKQDLRGIINISPELAEAVTQAFADPNNLTNLLILEDSANKGAGGLKGLQASLRDTANSLTEALGGKGDLNVAITNLKALKSSTDLVVQGLENTGGEEAAAKVREDYAKATGVAGESTDNLIKRLENIQATRTALAASEKAANIITHDGSELLKMEIESQKIANELKLQEIIISSSASAALKKEANDRKALLLVEQALLRAKKAAASFRTLGATGGSATIAQQADFKQNEASEAAERARFEEQKKAGQLSAEEFDAQIAALETRYAKLQQITGVRIFGALAEDFKALGPEGELMSATAQGIENIGLSYLAFQEAMASGSGIDKAIGAMGVLGSAISSIGAIQKASSDARIRALDQEIAAEKKRDGNSAASQARIKELEKKKVAAQRKAFEQEKKMKMASTIINTATAAMRAVAEFGPLIGGIMAAAMVAMGAKQLAIISGTTFQGGGSSVGGGPTAISAGNRRNSIDMARSQGARGELAYMRGESGIGGPENFRPAFGGYKNRAEGGSAAFMVGEQGPELFVPERPGRIVPNDDISAPAPSNVTFNINTVDATGVETLLTQQRGNIIGMVREAANSYGQDFIEEVDTSVFTQNSIGVSRY